MTALSEKVADTAAAQQAGTAVERATKDDSIYAVVRRHQDQFARALPQHVDPARFTRLAVTALRDNPNLAACDTTSVLGGLMRAAQYGLEVNDERGQCWLIPRKIKGRRVACFQFGYVGLIDLAGRAGITVAAFDIHEHDTFTFDQGSPSPPSHTYSLVKPRGDVIAYWARGTLLDGRVEFRILTKADAEHVRDQFASSRNRQGELTGPWVDTTESFDAMARKSTIIRLLKYMPLTAEMRDVVDHAERIEAAPAAATVEVFDVDGEEVVGAEPDVVDAAESVPPADAGEAPAAFDCEICQGTGRDPEDDQVVCAACNGSGAAAAA